MPMPPIQFLVTLFRDDLDQPRSQLALLWLMESLCRVNQTLIRHQRRIGKPLPELYKSGIHYEREPPGVEKWPDIVALIEGRMGPGKYPGIWGDCLPVSTLVLRDDYTMAPIGSLKPGDRIMGDGSPTTVVEQAITGYKPILNFELDNGCHLRCSPNHKLFLKDGSEKRAEDIKPGDLLLTPTTPFATSESPCEDDDLSPDNLAWLLGTYIADGWHGLPHHPRFCISGRDGKPKEAQKKRVQAMAEDAGLDTRWDERYIAVNDKRLAELMASCGGHAPNKHVPNTVLQNLSLSQVKALLEGLAADASVANSGTVVYGTTSQELALQIRVLYRMLGQSVHIKRWDDHGGLGKNPIYRINVRTRVSSRSTAARVKSITEEAEELCADIETDSGRFYLPESDLIVHNCEDLACWRVAELREAPFHFKNGRKVAGGVKAKPFAKWRRAPTGAFHYHALVLRPDGNLEDPSLTLGMRREARFAAEGIADKLKTGRAKPLIRFAKKPDVLVLDPSKPDQMPGAGRPPAEEYGTVLSERVKMPLVLDSAGLAINNAPGLYGETIDESGPTLTDRVVRLEKSVFPPKEPYAKQVAKRTVQREAGRLLNQILAAGVSRLF